MSEFRTDRMTDIQRNVTIVEEQAQAIRRTAAAVEDLLATVETGDRAAAADALFAIRAKLDGIGSWSHQIWATCGLLRSADEYQQRRFAEARAAAEPTAVDVLGDADGEYEPDDEYNDDDLMERRAAGDL